MSASPVSIPARSEVPAEHTWDLSALFPDDTAWEQSFQDYKQRIQAIGSYRGSLGVSAGNLKTCLDFMMEIEQLDERLGYYAQLRLSEDGADAAAQDRLARYTQTSTEAQTLSSYQTPEIQAIPDDLMRSFWPQLGDYHVYLEKLLRYKPHVLSEAEERILAMQEEANQTAAKAFAALTDVDLDYGIVHTPEGERQVTQSTYQSLLMHPLRSVREQAARTFMSGFDRHKNTLATLYAGSVNLDVCKARVRKHGSSREARLFPDAVPASVYDTLVNSVHGSLPVLHRYYELRRRVLGVERLAMYDTKVPLIGEVEIRHSFEEAIDLILKALAPLGTEYCTVLGEGLRGRWVDRYENRGKRSGAFSAGSYHGAPYILMNYKDDLLRDVFTLAHEAGHSMHSWYSVRANPFQHYHYSIFVAEVASTFNEQLLMEHLERTSDSPQLEAYLVNKHIDDIVGTFFRQTMFAEFEDLVHRAAEGGRPATLDSLRAAYRGLLETYFGPALGLEPFDDLEGLRIPHFYRSFYVYKYATGLAAAVSLSRQVLSGGERERTAYIDFLKSGGSLYPLDALKRAGVDMTGPQPVEATAELFRGLVERLEAHFAREDLSGPASAPLHQRI